MSEMVEAFKAVKGSRKAEKNEAWNNREAEWMQPLREAGFQTKILSFGSRHCRTQTQNGHFDFWPSSGVWIGYVMTKNHRPKIFARGNGIVSMLEKLTERPPNKTPAKIT